ncbi:hypothetical protein [Meiothermus sp.]|uniref:hypothetical protein n=1 Tax=Meiothermus sp. TaxID=1955249 RepID=UPI0021DEDDA3|nr:hypothetical protein [Meiothermus sp.]GIW32859.1 MAG: hypothetical protein KatS3mg072_0192 [Meiothermus sp.]
MKRAGKSNKEKTPGWPDDFPVIEPTKKGKPALPKPFKLKPGKKTSLDYVREQRR